MIEFLITVSLALNMSAIMMIIILFLRQNKLVKMEENLKEPIVEMEELISAYLLEMREENDRFIRLVTQLKKEDLNLPVTDDLSSVRNEKVFEHEQTETTITDLHEEVMPAIGKTINRQAALAYQKQKRAVNSDKIDEIEVNSDKRTNKNFQIANLEFPQSISEQISQLKAEGYTTEDIAKKMDKGKTEIELMLKFQEKNKNIT